MTEAVSTGIGRAVETITGNAGKGNKGDKFRIFNNKNPDVTTFASFFESKKAQFTANMEQAAENQSNGQSHGQG
jgi:hypothetical protein